MIGYSVELYFDQESEGQIRALWHELGSYLTDIGSRPHISLAVCSHEVDPLAMSQGLDDLARVLGPFCLSFSSIGIFPGPRPVIFLAPVVTRPLLELHQTCCSLLAAQALLDNNYRPGNWVPHCTIAWEPGADLSSLAHKAAHRFKPLKVMVQTLSLTRFSPVQELFSWSLQ